MKIVVAWMSAFVFSVLASEQEVYKGDLGELIFELVLKNTPKSLNYRDLCVCSGANKVVARLYAASKAERLRLVHDELKQHVMTKHADISADDIVVSPQFPAAGYAYKVSDTPYFECLRMNSKGVFETNTVLLAYKGGKNYKNCAKKPHYMNDTFCFAYQCHDTMSRLAYMVPRVACINRLGRMRTHPFPQDITLNNEEMHALSTYFLRDVCRVVYFADAIKNLEPESQYKLANLFACYASPEEMFDYVDYCCDKKSKHFWWLGTLKMSVIDENWEFDNNPELGFCGEAGASSVFMQATLNKIEQLKQEKCFVKPEEQMKAFPWKHRVQQWKAFINYLNNKRVTLKRCGDTILRYDNLSSTVRVISCISKKIEVTDGNGKQSTKFSPHITNVSNPVVVPKNVDVSTLTYTDDNRLKYAFLPCAEGEAGMSKSGILGWAASLMQDKHWMFSGKITFLNPKHDLYNEEKI